MRNIDPASYLRGFFDGEGHVSRLNRVLTVTNTDRALIDQACRCLDALAIPYTVFSIAVQPPRRAKWTVNVARRDAAIAFIRVVGSSAPAKRAAMAALLRWYRRPGQPYRTRWSEHPAPAPSVYADLRAAGMTVAQIAHRLGVPHATAQHHLSQHGLTKRPRLGPPPPIDEVRRAYEEEGLSLRDLGERFGYRGASIAGVLRRHGIARRPGGWPASGGRRHRLDLPEA